MGCGCSKNKGQAIERTSKQNDDLTGKMILDNNDVQMLVTSPIYDSYKDIVGYSAKTLEGKVVRIFAKNVQKILE